MITVVGLMQFNGSEAPQVKGGVGEANIAVRGHVFNRVIDRAQRAIQYDRSTFEVDAFAQLFFDSVSDGQAAVADGLMRSGIADSQIADMTVVTALQNTVVAPPIGKAIKRMSLLKKRPDVSTEMFQQEWFDMHSVLVKRLTGLRGYRQNFVLDGPRSDDGGFQVDGIVELWFEDLDAIEVAFNSPRGNTLMTHAKEFIGQINTYVVDPEVLKLQAAV